MPKVGRNKSLRDRRRLQRNLMQTRRVHDSARPVDEIATAYPPCTSLLPMESSSSGSTQSLCSSASGTTVPPGPSSSFIVDNTSPHQHHGDYDSSSSGSTQSLRSSACATTVPLGPFTSCIADSISPHQHDVDDVPKTGRLDYQSTIEVPCAIQNTTLAPSTGFDNNKLNRETKTVKDTFAPEPWFENYLCDQKQKQFQKAMKDVEIPFDGKSNKHRKVVKQNLYILTSKEKIKANREVDRQRKAAKRRLDKLNKNEEEIQTDLQRDRLRKSVKRRQDRATKTEDEIGADLERDRQRKMVKRDQDKVTKTREVIGFDLEVDRHRKSVERKQAKKTKTREEISVDLEVDRQRKSLERNQARETKTREEISFDLEVDRHRKSVERKQAKETKTTEEISVDLEVDRQRKSLERKQARETKIREEISFDLEVDRHRKSVERKQAREIKTREEISVDLEVNRQRKSVKRKQATETKTREEISVDLEVDRQRKSLERKQARETKTREEISVDLEVDRQRKSLERKQARETKTRKEISVDLEVDRKRKSLERKQARETKTREEISVDLEVDRQRKSLERKQVRKTKTREEISVDLEVDRQRKSVERKQARETKTRDEISFDLEVDRQRKSVERKQARKTKTRDEISFDLEVDRQRKSVERKQARKTKTREEISVDLEIDRQRKSVTTKQARETKTREEISVNLEVDRQRKSVERKQARETKTREEISVDLEVDRQRKSVERKQARETKTREEISVDLEVDRQRKSVERKQATETKTREEISVDLEVDRQRKSVERKQARETKTREEISVDLEVDRRRKHQKRHPSKIEQSLQLFQEHINNFAQYICTSCHRLLYKKSVLQVTSRLCEKIPQHLRLKCIQGIRSADAKESLCYTCCSYLQKKKLPPQSDANSLHVTPVPEELKILTSLEVRLLCQRYPFMKLIALPKGKQSGLKGTVVNIPVEHSAVCKSLPLTPSQAGIIPLKLKRRIKYRGYTMFQYIRPEKVLQALHWLQNHNDLYRISNVQENKSWESMCAEDDIDTWKQLTTESSIPSQGNTENQQVSVDSVTVMPSTSTQVDIQPEIGSPQLANKEDSEEDDYEEDPNGQLRGVKYDTCIQSSNPVLDVDKIVNIAPGENKHPISILMDDSFEQLAFPHLLPDGQFGWKYTREVPLTAKKYFQKRLLDADTRFARDVEYLFVAQTITETKQVIDSMSIALRKCHRGSDGDNTLNAGLLRDSSSLKQFIFKDQAYRFLQPVRGSPPYWQQVQYKLLSAIKQLGIFTWFFTLSAADLRWHDTIKEIKAQSGEHITDETIDGLTWEQKCHILRSNPVSAARHFQHRLDQFLRHVILGKAEPVGKVRHYFYRIEFQQRGSPHAHGVLWIENAPDPDNGPPEVISHFVDKYVSCKLPDQISDPELHALVTQVQRHSHSASCKKTGKLCRFNFPKPISSETLMTSSETSEAPEIIAKKRESAREVLSIVKSFLENTENVQELSYSEVLKNCNIPEVLYQQSLLQSCHVPTVYLKRNPSDININNYNKWLLLGWQANMDLQFVSNAYACIQYIVSYITKEEREMGTLLQAIGKETADQGIRQQMKKCGQAFLNARSITAQEAAYRVLGLPLYKSNFSTVWIPTGLPTERVSLLKPPTMINNLDDEDEDIFMSGILDKYSCRPNELEHWFLTQFAAWYQPGYKNKDTNDFQPDVLQDFNDNTENHPETVRTAPATIKVNLPSHSCQLKKRKKQAVVRFHKFSEYRQPEEFYHSHLLLFVPYITTNKATILKHDQLIEEAIESKDNPPLNAWDDLAAETLQEQYECDEEGAQVDPEHALLYPHDDSCQDQAVLPEPAGNQHCSLAIDTVPTILPFDEYCKHIQSLNKEQYQVLQVILDWCVTYKQTKQKPDPLYLFVSGGAGTGKSHLITALYHTIQMTLRCEGEEPGTTKVLLLAPTGTAAFNIEGITIHSALLFSLGNDNKKNKGTYKSLSDEKRNTLRAKLSSLCFIIIDEISMVGSDLFLRIHQRLDELFGGSKLFGGISIIAFGDMYQIPPVAQRFVFMPPKDNYAALGPSLWADNFQYIELTQIMRQQGDKRFAEMLNRIRTGAHTSEDIDLLKTRNIDPSLIPSDILHVYPFNAEVNKHNDDQLKQLPDPPVLLQAVDKKPLSMKDYNLSDDERFTGGLPSVVKLAKGARIMLIRNVDVSDGLSNGTQGEVIDFKYSNTNKPLAVLIKFDNTKVGKNARLQSPFDLSGFPNDVVPITPIEATFSPTSQNLKVTRKQFPIKLCWASTIHKVQGATLSNIAISFKRSLGPGKGYVALSRAKTLDGLYLSDFDPNQLKTDSKVTAEMQRLATESALKQSFDFPYRHCVSVSLLNARSAKLHFRDILGHPVLSQSDIICLTETNITDDNADRHQIQEKQLIHLGHCTVANCHGLAIYATSKYRMQLHTKKFHPFMELLCAEILFQRTTHTIALVYRSPSTPPKAFIDHLSQWTSTNLPHVILGDMNIDPKTAAYKQLTRKLSGYRQIVNKATHISGSTLDLIFIRHQEDIPDTYIFPTYFSDHSVVHFPLCY